MVADESAPGADMSRYLTLHEAADRLGVHYMTVYRHVRTGVLPAHKVGGSWRVDAADLVAQETERGTNGHPVVADPVRESGVGPTSRRRAPWANRLQQRMLAGDTAGAWQVVEAAMASGVEPADIYVEMLGPVLHRIGADWQRGALRVDQEHLATSVATSIVGRLGPRFRRQGRRRGTVLVAMPVGERHGIGVAMLADILAQAGYEVLNLGTDTPPASLAGAVAERDDLRAVVISVVDVTRLPGAGRLIAAARRADPTVPIFAGGFAIPDNATAKRIGADAWASDPRRLAGLIAERSAG